METSLLICSANHWTGFYIISTSVMKGLKYEQRFSLFISNILAVENTICFYSIIMTIQLGIKITTFDDKSSFLKLLATRLQQIASVQCQAVLHTDNRNLHLFLYKQPIFDPRPKNCLSFSKKSSPKIV